MFQVHNPDDGSIFLSFSVYLDRSHSSFPFILLFIYHCSSFKYLFIYSVLIYLFLFLFSFLLCFTLFSFPFPFLIFFQPPIYAQIPAERKKDLSASWWPSLLPSSKKANWARPLREFPGNYLGKYASSFVGRELNEYTHVRIRKNWERSWQRVTGCLNTSTERVER